MVLNSGNRVVPNPGNRLVLKRGNPAVRERLLALCAERGWSLPTNIVEAVALPVITSLLQQSEMIVALPEEVVMPYCHAGMLSVLVRNLPLGVGAFGLITRRRHPLSPGAQLMLNTLREVAVQIYPADSRGTPSPDRQH